MAVTLKTIAQKAGVDVSVVSRVLNNKSEKYRISSKRKDQILRISKELGYLPNTHAQSISSGKFNCVALVCSAHKDRSYLSSSLTDAISYSLEENDKHLLLARIPDRTTSELSCLPLVFRTLSSDGLLINYTHHMPEELVCTINNIGLCVVWLNVKVLFDTVYTNSFKAGQFATERFLELGHRKIAYVDIYHPEDIEEAHFSAFDRYDGYASAMASAGLEPIRFSPEKPIYPGEKAVKFFYDLLSRPDRPSAILTYWSHSMGAVYKAANLLKIKIPDELSIITFASESSIELGLNATAMLEPGYKMGCAAVDLYLTKEEKGVKQPAKILDYEFYDMGTCVKPSK
jgi:LacI family transcriptional regulator